MILNEDLKLIIDIARFRENWKCPHCSLLSAAGLAGDPT
jgi:hypothetical protein